MRLIRAAAVMLLAVSAVSCNRTDVEIIAREDLPPNLYGGANPRRADNDLVLYMVQGTRLVRVSRSGETAGPPAEVALRELLAGPTAEELTESIVTRLPEGLELRGVEVAGDIARVDLSRDFLVVADPSDPHEYLLRVAQIVWTLDELPDVNAVQFLIDGQLSPVLDQDREVAEGPVARKRYQRYEPRQERPVSQAPLQIDI